MVLLIQSYLGGSLGLEGRHVGGREGRPGFSSGKCLNRIELGKAQSCPSGLSASC